MRHAIIQNNTTALKQPILAAYCDSFLCRFKGLMLRPTISPGQGFLLVQPIQDRFNSSIHMFFMRFDIACIWINQDSKVVDIQYARQWHPYYAPSAPARFILETHVSHLEDFNVGDSISFKLL
jgi:uncharacterized membrane protein (UPF0127 family)